MCWMEELSVSFDEVHDAVVRKNNLADGKFVFALVVDQVQEEVIKVHISHLLEVQLPLLDLDEPIPCICDVHLDWMPQSKIYHVVVIRENEQLYVPLLDVHVGINQNGNL